MLKTFTENIEKTVGCEYELVVVDNTQTHYPIAKAYNIGAAKAKYPYLLFAHEDIEFYTQGWGKTIEDKLKEPDCGVIGFAGATVKTKTYSGWDCRIYNKLYFNYHSPHHNKIDHYKKNQNSDFDQVVNLDGLAMFVRREVWEQYPFDEVNLTGFHCYDLDFSMTIARHYHNYVCQNVDVLHKSDGSYSKEWTEATVRLHDEKWNEYLPLYVNKPAPNEMSLMEENTLWWTFKKAWHCKSPLQKRIMTRYRQCPMVWRHFRRRLSTYLWYV